MRRPRPLVLDDSTSAVDSRVEAAILAGLRDRSGDGDPRTVIVVAYRKATVALADEVVYVEHGRVVDRGTHSDLPARCDGYRRLITAYEREEADRQVVQASASAAGRERLADGGGKLAVGVERRDVQVGQVEDAAGLEVRVVGDRHDIAAP